ncbi:hypothetical protein CEXT_51061 [Caerostris extrusa]|uniref:Uncharacterized protein n=1 Tax=Caerostris extrusa TaxID=172846 RepID=A0AAV4MX79_CAEEX|nr:hypothetical protein CEXT_51061 [Caerostris extrusa]
MIKKKKEPQRITAVVINHPSFAQRSRAANEAQMGFQSSHNRGIITCRKHGWLHKIPFVDPDEKSLGCIEDS